MTYLPVFLDIRNWFCLVIGNGPLAEEKAAWLEHAGARVERQATLVPEEAKKAQLIVAVTNDTETGKEIRQFADAHRILVNVVDQIENCSFIAPAVMQQGSLLIAISTEGKSPVLASQIRRELEEVYGPEYGTLLELLGEVRAAVKERLVTFAARKEFYQRILDFGLVQTVKQKGLETARRRVLHELESVSPSR